MEDLAYDPNHSRIAAVGSGCLKLFIMNATCEYVGYFTEFDSE